MKILIRAIETVEYEQIIDVSDEVGRRLLNGYANEEVTDKEYSDYIDRKDVFDSDDFEVTGIEEYIDD